MSTTTPRPQTALAFLRRVWKRPGYHTVCLGRKDEPGSPLRERWFHLPTDWPTLEETLTDPDLATYDVYYCPTPFSNSRRLKVFAQAVEWAWSDLDSADPAQPVVPCPEPTLVLESSPGRWQALWRLTEPLPSSEVEAINRGLAYKLGGDPSGWDIGQLLRLPGFPNRKYVNLPTVAYRKNLSSPGVRHAPAAFAAFRMATASDVPSDADQAALVRRAGRVDAYRLHEAYRYQMPGRVNQLLDAPVYGNYDDRSVRLWELECALFEFEFKPHEVFALVQDTIWNKYRGQDRENAMLAAEVLKAYRKITSKLANIAAQTLPDEDGDEEPQGASDPDLDALLASAPVVDKDFDYAQECPWVVKSFREWIEADLPKPRFIVEGILQEFQSLGVLGASKTLKSFFLKDLGLSIASGHPLFNLFTVNEPMPVLYIQQEIDEPTSQERGRRIAHNKGLADHATGKAKRDIPFHLIEMQNVSIAREPDRGWIEVYIRQLGIRVLILDPWYLSIAPADENSAREVSEIAAWLITLQTQYGCQVILAHHLTKAAANEGISAATGARGTSVFGNFLANTINLVGDTKNDLLIRYTRKFRNGQWRPFQIRFELDPEGGSLYIPHVDDSTETERRRGLKMIRDLLDRTQPEETVPVADVVRKLGLPDRIVDAYIRYLADDDVLTVANPRVRGVRTPSIRRKLSELDKELLDL